MKLHTDTEVNAPQSENCLNKESSKEHLSEMKMYLIFHSAIRVFPRPLRFKMSSERSSANAILYCFTAIRVHREALIHERQLLR